MPSAKGIGICWHTCGHGKGGHPPGSAEDVYLLTTPGNSYRKHHKNLDLHGNCHGDCPGYQYLVSSKATPVARPSIEVLRAFHASKKLHDPRYQALKEEVETSVTKYEDPALGPKLQKLYPSTGGVERMQLTSWISFFLISAFRSRGG